MGQEKQVLSIRGVVLETTGDKCDKHYVLTHDDRTVYASSLLQWFVGKHVDILIREVADPSGTDPLSAA